LRLKTGGRPQAQIADMRFHGLAEPSRPEAAPVAFRKCAVPLPVIALLPLVDFDGARLFTFRARDEQGEQTVIVVRCDRLGIDRDGQRDCAIERTRYPLATVHARLIAKVNFLFAGNPDRPFFCLA
jgi:hypothetical protein